MTSFLSMLDAEPRLVTFEVSAEALVTVQPRYMALP
jgi:hypothetical protein